MSTQWNEILSNTGKYTLFGSGGQDVPGEPPGMKHVLLHWTERIYVVPIDPATVVGDGGHFAFVETNGGRLTLQTASGESIGYDGTKFVRTSAEPTYFLADEAGGNVVLRFEHTDAAGAEHTLYAGLGAPDAHCQRDLVGMSDPNAPEHVAHWQLNEATGPGAHPNLARWLHTYIPENRFSPMAFLEHIRIVVNGDDPVHNDPAYLSGLSAAEKASILTKIDAWESDFAAASALQRAEANGAMLLTSAHFYNHPTSEFNELDPKKPPEWSEVDDELGGNPYPG